MLWSCRDRARQLFSDGLQMALPDVPDGDVAFASAEVESAMYRVFGGVNRNYKTKSRSLSFNIKDPKNPDLRRRVLAGDVTGEALILYSNRVVCRKQIVLSGTSSLFSSSLTIPCEIGACALLCSMLLYPLVLVETRA